AAFLPGHKSVSSSFPIQNSMLDVRCSMFIFFSKCSLVHPAQKQLSAYGTVSLVTLPLQAMEKKTIILAVLYTTT
ncbi:MAG: hypothetical protein K8R75_02795, partial [Deltaproteobacteria bacterium]|nr:hypothetical protein [Deltaproteobacteria bacterium]